MSSRSCQWLKDACANSPILLLSKFGNLACRIFLHLILMAQVFDIGNGRNDKQWHCFWSRACTRTLLWQSGGVCHSPDKLAPGRRLTIQRRKQQQQAPPMADTQQFRPWPPKFRHLMLQSTWLTLIGRSKSLS